MKERSTREGRLAEKELVRGQRRTGKRTEKNWRKGEKTDERTEN